MTNRVAVITGGTRGLGRAVVAAFSEQGYRVAANYLQADAEARALEKQGGGSVAAFRADVSRAEEVSRMAEDIMRRWGRVDVLVNNAGIARDALLPRQREEEWDRVMAVNLKGAFVTLRAFAPLMTEGGHIINISSYSGLKGAAGQAAYSASKAALLGLTKTAAAELAGLGIRVNALLPGYLPTEMGTGAGDALERARRASLLAALSDAAEVARFIVYLAGTRAITGQVFGIDSRIL